LTLTHSAWVNLSSNLPSYSLELFYNSPASSVFDSEAERGFDFSERTADTEDGAAESLKIN